MFVCQLCGDAIEHVLLYEKGWYCKVCWWKIIDYVDPPVILGPQGLKIVPSTDNSIQTEMEECMKDRD